jgi:hypothetical protein
MPASTHDGGVMPLSRRSLLSALPAVALGTGALVAGTASPSSAEPFPRKAVGPKTWTSGVTSATADTFGAWRGTPISIIGQFADTTVTAQRELYQFCNDTLNCDVDLAVGGPIGSTWAQAAAGSQQAIWADMAKVLQDNWHYRTVYLRYAHEANGTWMPWSVAPSEVPAFKATFRAFATTMRRALPNRDVKIVWAPNFGTWRYTPATMFPGADVVDVIGVSMYEWSPYDTAARWRAFNASSIGPATWQRFARSVGRPMSLSEWGGKSPYFLRSMNAFMRANAGRGAGNFLYDVYLNNTQFKLAGTAASAYRALRWGS